MRKLFRPPEPACGGYARAKPRPNVELEEQVPVDTACKSVVESYASRGSGKRHAWRSSWLAIQGSKTGVEVVAYPRTRVNCI
jgi:hypothetical protein